MNARALVEDFKVVVNQFQERGSHGTGAILSRAPRPFGCRELWGETKGLTAPSAVRNWTTHGFAEIAGQTLSKFCEPLPLSNFSQALLDRIH